MLMDEKNDESVQQLEKEIDDNEKKLVELRIEYMKKTGHMPIKLNDFEWKWAVFMGVGFAFISMIAYLLGSGDGKNSGKGIPNFFFGGDIEYFVIMTMYALLMIMMTQARKLSGLQSMSFILGFWCMQWFFYDWGWQFYQLGVGDHANTASWWQSAFNRSFLVMNTPYWMFLTDAIIGLLIGIYTFTFPRRRRHLIPPILWLYGAYFNPTILHMTGVSDQAIFVVAICFLVTIFGTMGLFIIQWMHTKWPDWRENKSKPRQKRKLSLEPLGFPLVILMVGMVAMTDLFLLLSPAIGLFFGLIPWYLVPIYYILIHATGVAKSHRVQKIIVVSILTALFVAFIIVVSLLPLGDIIG